MMSADNICAQLFTESKCAIGMQIIDHVRVHRDEDLSEHSCIVRHHIHSAAMPEAEAGCRPARAFEAISSSGGIMPVSGPCIDS